MNIEITDKGRAEYDALVRDAMRYRWLRDNQFNSISVSRNDDHACNYMSAAEWIKFSPDMYADESDADKQAMADANTIWSVHWYPSTPVGFYVVNRSTLNAAIDAAMEDSHE